MTIDRIGAVAAIICGATYVFGFAFLLAVLVPGGFEPGGGEAAETLAAIAANRTGVTLWYFVIYIVNALFLAALAAALAERIGRASPGLGRLTLAFGLMWSTLVLGAGMVMNVGLSRVLPLVDAGDAGAMPLWRVVELIENGLGGGNEIAGGAWALVLALTGLATATLPRLLCWFGLVIGVAGLLTALPILSETVGAVFGLGYIVWFFWVGGVLFRGANRPA
ncbi:hypothetical protein [Salibaculum sp.]|uniref:hypothetical protein n=1 Tax=Salibaculum sp. TaxID=2855480 RepID=UPI002B4A13DF|nr:hypothetical protein [Salibaculum sp.]HKL70166.1 hypothetical protein [Salibaculum sp.]